MTNGDVIKAIFPCIDEKSKLFKDNGTQYDISIDIGIKWASLDFDKVWWNLPYPDRLESDQGHLDGIDVLDKIKAELESEEKNDR